MIDKDSNNILTVILKDDSHMSFAFPSAKSKEEAFREALIFESINEDDVKEYHYSVSSDKTLESFNYFDSLKNEIDEKAQAIDFKCDEARKERELLFKKLDMEFMKSLEGDCIECKNHIVQIKNYMRDMPDLMKEEFEGYDNIKDIIFFNPFNNIFKIAIIDFGGGYLTPPQITIDPPNGNKTGFQLEATASIKDGSIFEINVTKVGSGYIDMPKVRITPPDEENGGQAIAIALLPENDIYME